MLNNKQEFKINYGGKEVIFETGRLAKQADGAVLVSSGAAQVLVTVCWGKEVADGQDFFPLLVDYKEKFYAAGRFLGGFIKREGRPTSAEILLMRMIDRPFRPMFPEGFMNETIITAQVMSYDPEVDHQILAGLGASAALATAGIPILGNVAFCRVVKIDGKLILNPAQAQLEKTELELIVAASNDAILMVEGEANLISETEMLEAIEFAHTNIKQMIKLIDTIREKAGKPIRSFTPITPNKDLMKKVEAEFGKDAAAALAINPKMERQEATGLLIKKVKEAVKANPGGFGLDEGVDAGKEAAKAVDLMLYNMMRKDILVNEKRIGGRKMNQVRPIETEIGVLNKVHGSSLFTRGETQVLAAVTLGGKDGEQMADNMAGITYDKFYLHYTFAPFSVGEARGYRGVGRREVGHGNLAERALKKAMIKDDFPYTVRVNCEVLESNGSSSMGSVCSGSMALMDAGVPLVDPVAGVAMGLVKEGNNYKILTDILGDEDHLGDMDFKVAGTHKGITAIQMDIKIAGITKEIFAQALEDARVGRLHILGEMAKTISKSASDYKDGVPVIGSTKIPTDKIGALIGPGGKNIKGIQEQYKVTLECLEDGTVNVLGTSSAIVNEVIAVIDLQINGPKLDSVYKGEVVSIKEYGAFVDLVPGISGLLHVSEISNDRVNDVNEYLKVGSIVDVKVLEVDRFGKIKLSAKAIQPLNKLS